MAVEWSPDLMRELHGDLCAWLGGGVLPHFGWVIGIHVISAMNKKQSLDIQVNWSDFWENAVTLNGKPYAPVLARVAEIYPVGVPDELQQYTGLLFDTCPLRLAQKKELARANLDNRRQLQSLFIEADLEDQVAVIEVYDLPLYISYVPELSFDPYSVNFYEDAKNITDLKGF